MKKVFLTLSLFSAMLLAFSATANAACLSPTNLSATNRLGTSVKLNWSKVNGATKYQFQLESVGSNPYLWQSSTLNNGNTTSYLKTGLTVGNNYHFRIRAFCADGIWTPWSYYLSFNSGGSYKPGTPNELLEADLWSNEVGKTAATLHWRKLDAATNYQVQVSGFREEDYEVNQTSTVENAFKIENLTPGHDYVFRVRAFDADGWGTWSQEQELTTQEGLAEAPQHQLWASNLTQRSAVLNWGKVPSASAYQVQMSPVTGFDNEDYFVQQETFRENTATSFKMDGLESDKTYEFRVRTADENGEWGNWSEFSAFSTEERTGQTGNQAPIAVNVSPNPAVDFVAISIDSDEISAHQLTLVSAAGQTVRTATLDAGQNQHIFQVNDLATGLYFVRIASEGGQQVQKVVVSH